MACELANLRCGSNKYSRVFIGIRDRGTIDINERQRIARELECMKPNIMQWILSDEAKGKYTVFHHHERDYFGIEFYFTDSRTAFAFKIRFG